MKWWSLVIGIAVMLVGCSFNSGLSTAAPVPTVHLGSTVVLRHSTAEAAYVTVLKLTDPLLGPHNPRPLDGYRFVGVTLTITNAGESILSGDADSATGVTGSDHLPYDPELESLAGCRNFHDGMYDLQPRETETGCVAFQLPSNVAVSKIQFELPTGRATGRWSLL